MTNLIYIIDLVGTFVFAIRDLCHGLFDRRANFYSITMDMGCGGFQYAGCDCFGDCDSDFGGEAGLVFAGDTVGGIV